MPRLGSLGRLVGLISAVLVCLPLLLIVVYRIAPPPGTPLMLLRDAPVDQRWVPLEAVADNVVRAVIVAEDQRFCDHSGIDMTEFSKVLDAYLDGARTRGASTITMQTAKNLFLWPGRSVLRKALELPLALVIEVVLPKRRILEIYLNIAEWGDGVYGIEAAARRHFDKPAVDLSASEAALLAAVLPDPLGRSAGRPSAAVRQRADRIARDVRRAPDLWSCVTRAGGAPGGGATDHRQGVARGPAARLIA